jgi:Pyruvate carboxylase
MAAGVWRCEVAPGTRVAAGAPLITLEAMKLEMPVRAPAPGLVLSVHVGPGDQVAPGQPLVVLGEASG